MRGSAARFVAALGVLAVLAQALAAMLPGMPALAAGAPPFTAAYLCHADDGEAGGKPADAPAPSDHRHGQACPCCLVGGCGAAPAALPLQPDLPAAPSAIGPARLHLPAAGSPPVRIAWGAASARGPPPAAT